MGSNLSLSDTNCVTERSKALMGIGWFFPLNLASANMRKHWKEDICCVNTDIDPASITYCGEIKPPTLPRSCVNLYSAGRPQSSCDVRSNAGMKENHYKSFKSTQILHRLEVHICEEELEIEFSLEQLCLCYNIEFILRNKGGNSCLLSCYFDDWSNNCTKAHFCLKNIEPVEYIMSMCMNIFHVWREINQSSFKIVSLFAHA